MIYINYVFIIHGTFFKSCLIYDSISDLKFKIDSFNFYEKFKIIYQLTKENYALNKSII